jgi:DNA-nicking Smr family endonuclease
MNEDNKNPFREEFADIKPLPQDKITLRKREASNVAIEVRKASAQFGRRKDLNYLTDAPVEPVEPLEVLEYKLDGVQTAVFKKLRQGKYAIEDHLDLHRHTVAEARTAIFQFLQSAIRQGFRTLLITHGKGERSNPPARLKSYVNHWLRQIPEVLAFHSAQKHHGGTGSVYVLLRKSEDERLANRERYQ